MGLLDLIKTSRFGLKGITPANTPGSSRGSKMHNTSSVNGQPPLKEGQNPSNLDLDAKTPKQYINNLPK